jgi:hypothetical protein
MINDHFHPPDIVPTRQNRLTDILVLQPGHNTSGKNRCVMAAPYIVSFLVNPRYANQYRRFEEPSVTSKKPRNIAAKTRRVLDDTLLETALNGPRSTIASRRRTKWPQIIGLNAPEKEVQI